MPKIFNRKALRAAREQLGLTQRQLAAMIGYNSSSSISRWEMGKSEPPPPVITLLASVLGISNLIVPYAIKKGERMVGGLVERPESKIKATVKRIEEQRVRISIRDDAESIGHLNRPLVLVVDASVDRATLADVLAELAAFYSEISDGDELVIRDGRVLAPEAVTA